MTVRLLLTLLLIGAFAGSALACPGMRTVNKPEVLASTDGTTTTDPVKLPATPRPN